jgi:acetyltransferase EpsM
VREVVGLENELIIVGAGGHAKVVLDVALANNVTVLGFLDDHATVAPDPRYQLFGTVNMLEDLMVRHPSSQVFIAIGDNRVRRQIDRDLLKGRRVAPALIHPFGCVSSSAQFGNGAILMPGVVVNAGTRVGRHAILNTSCSVDHDCSIGDYAHISPGAHLAGAVTVGEGCHVGTGASVIPGVRIGDWAVIGAGAVVTTDIPPRSVAVGVPARVVKMIDSE